MENINEMQLYELYYIVLLCKKYGEEEAPYDMDIVWNNISKYYYLEKNIYQDNHDVLFKWIKDRCRYELLDMMMLQVFNKFVNDDNGLNKTDPFFISNIFEMQKIIYEYGNQISKDREASIQVELSKMSSNMVIETVKEILTEIDPSLEWLHIYEKAISENKIIYIDLLDDSKRLLLEEMFGVDLKKDDINSCVFLNNKGIGNILLTYTGTISDVVVTMHEIVHYISRYKNEWQEEVPILREFSAIFYELYASKYLLRMNYSVEEIRKINHDRITDMAKLLDDANNLIKYLVMLMEHGKIEEEYDEEKNYSKVDKCISDLIDNPYLLNDYYPYLIGNYLATKGIKKCENDRLLFSMMKYITDNLVNIDAYDVFNVLECGNPNLVRRDDTLFETSKKKTKSIK